VPECRSVVTSIFVNPTQFGPNEDLDAYPRDLERDLALLERENVDLVWIPESDTMYPANYQTWVTVEQVTQRLEGGLRPGHFRGVTTVVTKLFNCVRPDRAYFGQRCPAVCSHPAAGGDLNIPVEVIITQRCESGRLAMSAVMFILMEERRAKLLYRALAPQQAYHKESAGQMPAENDE
jgi:pantoate--beta-alanine ligase